MLEVHPVQAAQVWAVLVQMHLMVEMEQLTEVAAGAVLVVVVL
jgi:hypothetical protein